MKVINESNVIAYAAWLAGEERSGATCEKYARDLRAFSAWLGERGVSKEAAVEYKAELMMRRKAATVNTVVAALNSFFGFIGCDAKLRPVKIQSQIFRTQEKELTRAEYERLLRAAAKMGSAMLRLIIETICSTGIRVSELRYITIEATRSGQAIIANKGKTRTIILPKKLQTALLRFAGKQGINSGCMFVTESGKPIDRRKVWSWMKSLCQAANVSKEKVYPHNLRHLFAREFYRRHKDVVRLADVLGHSNITTTRIYTMESGAEHRRLVDELGLASGY